MARGTTLTIHQTHSQQNLSTIKRQTTAKVLAMVKADAYGHGIKAIVPALTEADGFGVACMSEALEVKQQLVHDTRPIVLIEGVFDGEEWQQVLLHRFMVVIHHESQLAYALAQRPDPTSPTATVWLKLNTGMNRLGFDQTSLLNAADGLINKGYRLILTSHFACADDPTHPLNSTQLRLFNDTLALLKQRFGQRVGASLCNSAAFFELAQHHHDWVRIGIALYGATPLAHKHATTLELAPVMSFFAKVIAIHPLKKGATVGYGALWVADKDTTIAIISAGYGDGYPRVVKDAKVAIKGKRYPIVGRVAMDMLAVEIDTNIHLGDSVELWGQHISVDEVARWAGTIGYELLCRVTRRPSRVIDPPTQKNQTQALANKP